MTDLRSRSGLRRVSRRDTRDLASPGRRRSRPRTSGDDASIASRATCRPRRRRARMLSANRTCAESAAATADVVEDEDFEAEDEDFEVEDFQTVVSDFVACSLRSQTVVSAHLLGNSAPGFAGDGERPDAASAARALAACAGVRASNATRRSIAAARASTMSCGTRSGAWTRARFCARRWRWCRVTRFGDGGERGRDEIGSEGGMSRARRAVFSRGGGEGEGEVAGGGGVVRGAQGRGGGVGDGGDRAEDVRPGGAGRADRAVARGGGFETRPREGRAEVARTTPAASGRRRREIERRRDGDVRGVTGRLAPHVGGWRGRGRRAVRRERAPGARIRRERDARRSRERRVVDASRRR